MWNVVKLQTTNGVRMMVTTETIGCFYENYSTRKEAEEELIKLSQKMNTPIFNEEEDTFIEKGIPFVGIIAKDGYTEYYDEMVAEYNDYHHSFCLSQEGLMKYDDDDTLRFVYYKDINRLSIEGNPALDPFGKGRKQITQLCNLATSNGISKDTDLYVEQHFLNTDYEAKTIGKLYNFGG